MADARLQQMKQTGNVNHPLLLAVILLGVTGGNLLADYIEWRVVTYQAAVAFEGVAESAAAELRASAARSQTERRGREEAERQARIESKKGQELARRCAEWNALDAQQSGPTSRAGAREHCQRFEEFVRIGGIR